ncbi:MAG: MerR family transcriptional regulator [Erysipelotrichaceae bacterium]|nr:MerR family transcriptional regulator [Erysipelotrichaceae bacterium]
MNGYRTLREVCATLHLSRRAVQGYEEMGLVKPAARNKYGHLLYDEKTVGRIAGIQFCQRLGLSLKEISALTAKKPEEVSDILSQHVTKLVLKAADLEEMIMKTDEVITKLRTGDSDFLDVIYRMIKED